MEKLKFLAYRADKRYVAALDRACKRYNASQNSPRPTMKLVVLAVEEWAERIGVKLPPPCASQGGKREGAGMKPKKNSGINR